MILQRKMELKMVIFLDKNIDMGIDWLLNSGIQNVSGKHSGGFNGWYDVDNKIYPFVYSEITGYGITSLLFLNLVRKGEIFVQHAEKAAEWIIKQAMHSCGGVRARAYTITSDKMYSFENNILYIFDNGMVLPALVNLYTNTKKEQYLNTAIEIGNFLLSMQKDDGFFYAAYNASNNTTMDNQEKWSSQSGSYHAKLAIGLIDLYNATKNEAFLQSALKICNASLEQQQGDGRFVTQQNEKSTHMHPHCYSAEGLLYAGTVLKEDKFIQSAGDAIKWALVNQLPNGGMPCKFVDGKFISHERSDTLAQVLRLATYLRSIGLMDDDTDIENLKSRLVQFQKTEGEHKGGFFYGTELDGTGRNHINSWCSMFSLQSLIMHSYFKNRSKIGLNLFI